MGPLAPCLHAARLARCPDNKLGSEGIKGGETRDWVQALYCTNVLSSVVNSSYSLGPLASSSIAVAPLGSAAVLAAADVAGGGRWARSHFA